MTIQDYGSIGEIVGAIATVATLVYLALQIRQNTKTVRSASASSYVQAMNGVTNLIAENPELSDIYFKGLQAPEALSDSERRRFNSVLGSFIAYLQQADQMESAGTLPSDLAHQYNVQVEWLVRQPGFLAWWEGWGNTSPPGFTRRVNEAMRRAAASGRLGVFAEDARSVDPDPTRPTAAQQSAAADSSLP